MSDLETKGLDTSGLAVDFRRRLIAGVIVLAALAYPRLKFVNISALGDNVNLLVSPVFAVFLIAAAYIAGALVENAGEVFLARLAGNYLWAFLVPFTWFRHLRLPLRYLLPTIILLPSGIVLAYFYIARALLGRSDFRWLDSPMAFSPKAQDYFQSLPECVKVGLQAPFSDRQELSWKFLQSNAGSFGTNWLLSLENRNRDVLTIISALVISASILAYLSGSGSLQALWAISAGILVLFYLYLITLKKSIVDAVEWVSAHIHRSGTEVRHQDASVESLQQEPAEYQKKPGY
jgi:hypothetical protein